MKAGRGEEAMDHYRQVLASPQAANFKDIRSKLASLYLDACLYADAAREFKAALADSPNDLESVKGLAFAYAELGNYSEAAMMLEQIIQLDLTNLVLHCHAGFGYRHGLHDLPMAKDHYRNCRSGDIDKKYRGEARRYVSSLVNPTEDKV